MGVGKAEMVPAEFALDCPLLHSEAGVKPQGGPCVTMCPVSQRMASLRQNWFQRCIILGGEAHCSPHRA